MYKAIKDPNHTYAIEVLNDNGEWVLDMYDISTDYYSISKLYEYYDNRGYLPHQVRIVKVD